MSTGARARQRAVVLLAVAALGLAGLSSCSSSEDTSADASTTAPTPTGDASGLNRISGPPDGTDPTAGGQLVFAIEAEPEGLDPTRYAWASSGHYVGSAVYDPLATLGEEGHPVPYLAEAIEPNEDDTVWTLSVRDGVSFQDGTPADAEAIRQNLEFHRASLISQLAFRHVTDIALDGDQVVVTLDTPWAAFPSIMTSQAGYVVLPSAQEAGTLVDNPVGTGAFVFDNHVPNESWSFNRNEDYWRTAEDGTQLPYLDAIEYQPIPDSSARLAALEGGDVDVMITSIPAEVKQLRDSDFKLVEYGAGEEEFMTLNNAQPPFDNLTARLAVAHAVDAESFVANELDGVGEAPNGPFAPGQAGYLEDNGYPAFDLEESKRLVEQYEAETGEPLAFTFLSEDTPSSIAAVQIFKDVFESVGMTVEVEGLPQINLIAQVATGNYQISTFRNFGFPDPAADEMFLSPDAVDDAGIALNMPRIQDEDLQAAVDAAVAASDPAEQDAAWQEVNRILAAEVPYVWIQRVVWVLAAQTRVNGIYAAANGSIQTLGAKTWIAQLWIQQ